MITAIFSRYVEIREKTARCCMRLWRSIWLELNRPFSGAAMPMLSATPKKISTSQRANLRIRLRFEQGHLLEINVAVVVVEDSLVPLDYRYHCQDTHNQVIFRYDSTPHFPGFLNFPHHKHLSDDVIGCEKPDVEQVVREALEEQG